MGRHDDIHETPDVTHIHNPDVAHEESDVNIKGILLFTAGLFVMTAVIFILVGLMMKFFAAREAKAEPPPSPMALTAEERLPPASMPRLQLAPGYGVTLENGARKRLDVQPGEWHPPQSEYWILRDEWNEVLLKGRTDATTGAVTAIPIEQAIERMAQPNALPSRQQTGDAKSTYDAMREVPSSASSGRLMEVRRQ